MSPAHPRSRAHLTPAENCNTVEEQFSNRSLERFLSLSNFGAKDQGVVSVKAPLSILHFKTCRQFSVVCFQGALWAAPICEVHKSKQLQLICKSNSLTSRDVETLSLHKAGIIFFCLYVDEVENTNTVD